MSDAEIIRLDLVRAQRALDKFRATGNRIVAVDTLYGPVPKGLTAAEIDALKVHGLADVRRQRGSEVSRVTLTPLGRKLRDQQKRKAR